MNLLFEKLKRFWCVKINRFHILQVNQNVLAIVRDRRTHTDARTMSGCSCSSESDQRITFDYLIDFRCCLPLLSEFICVFLLTLALADRSRFSRSWSMIYALIHVFEYSFAVATTRLLTLCVCVCARDRVLLWSNNENRMLFLFHF